MSESYNHIILKSQKAIQPKTISAGSLAIMDESIRNFKSGKVSTPVDLLKFNEWNDSVQFNEWNDSVQFNEWNDSGRYRILFNFIVRGGL